MKIKQKQPNPYVKIPLILGMVGILAAILALLVKGTVALGIAATLDAKAINLAIYISAAAALLGLATYAMLAPESVRGFLGGRQARYGSNALILSLAFIGILTAVNVLAINNPKDQLGDLSEDKENTLSPEMTAALKTLPEKMTAIGFFSSQYPTDGAEKLLSNMQSNGDGNFEYRFIDPVSNPLETKKYGVTGDGKIVLLMSDRSEIADYADETELLRAMSRLLKPEERTVYFLIGHGERDINGSDSTGMSRAKETLESKNYTVKTLGLLAEKKIPEDARVVIVAGPMQPLTPTEVGLLNKYVEEGGSLIVMEDPLPQTDFGDANDPLAESLERVWGIRLRNDFVVDDASTVIQNAIGVNYSPTHPITSGITNFTIFPFARSIGIEPLVGEIVTLTPLVETSSDPQRNSWGETDFSVFEETSSSVAPDPEDGDTPGPLTLAAAGENLTTKGRVVVFGNSLFATDDGFDAYSNGDLFIAAVDWGAGDDTPIDITTHDPTQRIFLPPGGWQLIAILLGSICILPGIVLGAGAATYFARKRRG